MFHKRELWFLETIALFLYHRIRASKGPSGVPIRQMAQKVCAHSVARDIPMSLGKQKSCSAEASTILESPLHRAKAVCTNLVCHLPDGAAGWAF